MKRTEKQRCPFEGRKRTDGTLFLRVRPVRPSAGVSIGQGRFGDLISPVTARSREGFAFLRPQHPVITPHIEKRRRRSQHSPPPVKTARNSLVFRMPFALGTTRATERVLAAELKRAACPPQLRASGDTKVSLSFRKFTNANHPKITPRFPTRSNGSAQGAAHGR